MTFRRHGRFYVALFIIAIWFSIAMLAVVPAHAAEQCGRASWYGPGFHGRLTANGEVYNQWGPTAAHRTLPFGTIVTVRWGDRSVTVRISDRGPFIAGRIIDLSQGAATTLGMVEAGVVPVCITY